MYINLKQRNMKLKIVVLTLVLIGFSSCYSVHGLHSNKGQKPPKSKSVSYSREGVIIRR